MRNPNWQNLITPTAWWLWAIACAAGLTVLPWQYRLGALSVFGLLIWNLAGENRGMWKFTLRFAVSLVAMRVGLQIVLGADSSAVALFALPRIDLPLGLHIGGPVSWPALELAVDGGLSLAAVVLALGGVSLVCPPARLLAILPERLSNLAMVLAAATSLAPNLARDAARLKQAARWRGEELGRWGWVGRQAVPLAEGALERSLKLAVAVHLRRPSNSTESWRVTLNQIGWLIAALGVGLWLSLANSLWLLSAGIGLTLVVFSAWPKTRQASRQEWNAASILLVSVCVLTLMTSPFGSDETRVGLTAVLLLAPFATNGLVAHRD